MRTLALLVLGWVVLLGACGEDPASTPPFYEAPGAGGKTQADSGAGACTEYCGYITTQGAGCETYNDGLRCTKNCTTYATGPCPAEWTTYEQCVMKTTIHCEMLDAGKLALTTQGCGTEFSAFLTCLGEHDAGLCP